MPEFEAPTSGWLEVYVEGTRITRVSVGSNETVEVTMDTDSEDDD